MKKCQHCGAESYREESRYCLKCGQSLSEQPGIPHQNICSNPDCDWHRTRFIYPDDARFCDVCGGPTLFATN